MEEQRLATAEWTDPAIVPRDHGYTPDRLWLGRSPAEDDALGYSDDRHVCLVSGTRSGKGTTTIIPNLCLWPGSVVVVDPKGENATVTAARRGPGSEHCEGMGQAVHVLDPFQTAHVQEGLRSRFNPLDALDPDDPRTVDEAGRLADAIVVANPNSNDPFWDQSARALVKGLILHVLSEPIYEGRRSLLTVRSLLTRGDQDGIADLQAMGETELPSAHALLWESIARNESFGGVIAGIGEGIASIAANSKKTFESVIQVANRNTEFLDSPGMRDCLASSDFNLADIKTNPKGVSIFLSLPQRYMGEHFRWLRMMITLIVNEMEATPGRPATGHRVMMVLDEFAGLKRMESIENAVAQIAGFGLKLFFVLQSLEQLKATYKDNWETFLSNAGMKVFFGLDDHFSREYVSKYVGETELIRTTRTRSKAKGESYSRTEGRSTSRSTSDSTSEGVNFGENESTGTSRGRGKSNSRRSLPLYLNNTSFVVRGLFGDAEAGSNRSAGTSASRGTSKGTSFNRSRGVTESETVSHSETFGESTTRTSGTNEGIHKRPLITPDELGRFFSRVDDPSSPAHPGLGLVLLPGRGPIAVRRTNYFTDPKFIGLFDPHPDHPMPVRELPAPVVLESYRFGIDGLDKLRFLNGHPGGPDPDARWLVGPGTAVRQGDAVLRVKGLIGEGWGVPEFPGTLTFESPVAGQVIDCHPLDVPGQHRWMMTIAGKKQWPDHGVVSDNDAAVGRYCQAVKTLGRRIVTRIQLIAGVLIGLALTSFIWLIVGWPSRLLMGGLLAALVVGLAVYTVRNLARMVFMIAVSAIPIKDLDGVFVVEGPFPHDPGES